MELSPLKQSSCRDVDLLTGSISDLKPKRNGPPTVDDMAHARGDPARAKRTEELANRTLSPLGLSWEDVEDVIPMNSMQEMLH